MLTAAALPVVQRSCVAVRQRQCCEHRQLAPLTEGRWAHEVGGLSCRQPCWEGNQKQRGVLSCGHGHQVSVATIRQLLVVLAYGCGTLCSGVHTKLWPCAVRLGRILTSELCYSALPCPAHNLPFGQILLSGDLHRSVSE